MSMSSPPQLTSGNGNYNCMIILLLMPVVASASYVTLYMYQVQQRAQNTTVDSTYNRHKLQSA